MWPTFAKYEEYYDFTVSRSIEKDCYCYTLAPSSPISVPGATEWIQLMPTPYLAEGGTDVFTIYREAFLPPYNKENGALDKLELIHLLCKQPSPMWANTSLSQFTLFHRIYTDVSRLTQPQAPQMMFQDRCERNGAQYYLEQVQELDKNAQVSPTTNPTSTDVICTDLSKY